MSAWPAVMCVRTYTFLVPSDDRRRHKMPSNWIVSCHLGTGK